MAGTRQLSEAGAEGVNRMNAGVGGGPPSPPLPGPQTWGLREVVNIRVTVGSVMAALQGCCRGVGVCVTLQFNKFKSSQCWQCLLCARQPARRRRHGPSFQLNGAGCGVCVITLGLAWGLVPFTLPGMRSSQ